MRDLIIKKNELLKTSKHLKSIKFNTDLSREEVTKLIDEQNKIYKRWLFYKNYIKEGGKLNGRKKIHTKEM